MEYLVVSSHTKAPALAGAIAAVIRKHGQVEIRAIGAAAVNAGVKAIAIARQYVSPQGIQLVCSPAFENVQMGENGMKTVMKLVVEARGSYTGEEQHAIV